MNGKKNILLITLRADIGGGPEHVFRLLKHFSTNIVPFVAAPVDYPYWDRYAAMIGADHLFALPHRAFSFSYLLELKKFCRAHDVAIIHSHGKGAGIYSRLLGLLTGIPVVHTFHGLHLAAYSSVSRFLYIMLEKFFSKCTRAAISVSAGEKAALLFHGIIPGEKLHVIENGVELPPLEQIKSEFSNPFRILVVSRFDFAKNSELLVPIIQALSRKTEKFLFDIIGDGEQRTAIEAEINARGLSSFCRFHGLQPEPGQFYAAADCLLSTSRWEGLPLSVLEAMSYGVPAVVSDVTGNRDVVVHEANGFLYELSQPTEAADSLQRIMVDYELFKRLSRNAREHVAAHYTVSEMTSKTEAVYQSVLLSRL
jgi:glycosyltransferase involved in cell wall biosynthesis